MSYTNGLDKPSDYFNTVLYTGNGSTRSITGVGFQPDLVWFKARSSAIGHVNYDAVRGASIYLQTASSAAEGTGADSQTSFDTDGFSLGADTSTTGVNLNGTTYVAWNWLASNTTASNTVGDINSTVSVNTTSGFSIVSYTGTGSASTIGHGLGSAPKMVICKTRSITGEWITWHTGIDIQAKLSLNTTDAVYNPGTSLYWNSTLPTSSVFSVGTSGSVNSSGTTYIAYCFAEKKGFSKFGSYTGNGSTDGTFVYTGFKPAFFLIKRTDSAFQWYIHDNKRNSFNVMNKELYPSTSDAEATVDTKDFLSNGIKIRGTQVSQNASGGSYIYMAFAENPFVTSTGIPTTAR